MLPRPTHIPALKSGSSPAHVFVKQAVIYHEPVQRRPQRALDCLCHHGDYAGFNQCSPASARDILEQITSPITNLASNCITDGNTAVHPHGASRSPEFSSWILGSLFFTIGRCVCNIYDGAQPQSRWSVPQFTSVAAGTAQIGDQLRQRQRAPCEIPAPKGSDRATCNRCRSPGIPRYSKRLWHAGREASAPR